MTKTVSIFNNKGGVGKTTYMYHVAHMLSRRNLTVLMVDCDSQCNLTAYAMTDAQISKAWHDDGNSIYNSVSPLVRGIGDIRNRAPTRVSIRGDLFLVPSDLRLSDFEDLLGDTWNSAKGGSEFALRTQSAIHRLIHAAAEKIRADLVLVDLGPNLGALNRAVLAGSDFFITPVAPDLFSIQGTENLGNKLVTWRKDWDQCNDAWKGGMYIQKGRPSYLGYVVQMHNTRANTEQEMTAGWAIYGEELEPAIRRNIVDKLSPLGQAVKWDDNGWRLGRIPNLHSLIPYSLEARKPVFDCVSADGLRGAHLKRATDAEDHFKGIVDILEDVAGW